MHDLYTAISGMGNSRFGRLRDTINMINTTSTTNGLSFSEAASEIYNLIKESLPTSSDEESLPTSSDPLDEDDHRDRLDGEGDLLVRRVTDGLWIWPDFSNEGTTLKEAEYHEGPLTFAPQPEGADPLDENDHRPRRTSGGSELTRRDCGAWHTFGSSGSTCPNPSVDEFRHKENMSLLTWNESANGPLTFGD